MKKILFFDIDNTILPEGCDVVAQKTVDIINKLKANGHVVFLCTGRNEKSAMKIINQLQMENYITSNGQKIVIEGKEHYTSYYLEAEVQKITKEISKYTKHYAVETKDGILTENTEDGKELAKMIKGHGIVHVNSVDFIPFTHVFQVWSFGSRDEIDQVENNLSEQFVGHRWTENAIEICKENISKGTAIQQVKDIYGTGYQTFGFGDSVNDFSMFEYVDVKIAMSNAIHKLKLQSDYIAGDVKDAGIEKACTKYGL